MEKDKILDIKFRTEKAYDNGGHKPAEILAYETLCLANFWILEDLYLYKVKEYLSQSERADVEKLLKEIDHWQFDFDEDLDYTPYLKIFESVIRGLEKRYKMKINYLLWLGNLDDILDLYYDEKIDYLNDIDAYETGLEIIHFEGDGNLYAYSEKPKPLSKEFVKRALDSSEGLYKVFVYPGVGCQLQTLYFDHCNISMEEIGYVCFTTGKGYFLTLDQYKEEGYDDNNERFIYIDLSEYNCPNIMLSIENLTTDPDVELH